MDGTLGLLSIGVPHDSARGPHARRSGASSRPGRSARGFTLIELLVVIGIISVLIGILLPVLWRARTSAMKVVCASRLRELCMASTMFLDEHKSFPKSPQQATKDPLTGVISVKRSPHLIDTVLLNELAPYLKYPEVDAATSVTSLPPFVQCPFVEEEEASRGPVRLELEPDVATYFTGYVYLARLEEPPVAPTSSLASVAPSLLPALPIPLPILHAGTILKPKRAATAKDRARAVLWADDVYRTEERGGYWRYSHGRNEKPGPLPLTHRDHKDLVGQHRAYTDGSVEWVGAGGEGLNVAAPLLDLSATFKNNGEHWWY